MTVFEEISQNMGLFELPNKVISILDELGHPGWKFLMVPHIRAGTFGLCNYTTKTISVLHAMIDRAPEFGRFTVVHEMGHVLARGDGHGNRWKQACAELGYPDAQQYNQFLCDMPQRVQRLVYAYRMYYLRPDRTMELTETFSNRNYRLAGRELIGRPETKGRLFWLPL